jgi:hypothetical protein
MQTTTYQGVVVGWNTVEMWKSFHDGENYWPVSAQSISQISDELIQQLSLEVGDRLLIHELPGGELVGLSWDFKTDPRLSYKPDSKLHVPLVHVVELRRSISYFREKDINSDNWYVYEVMKMKSPMGPRERYLRRSCNVPDTVGFGSLRGILTGQSDQSREELPPLKPMTNGSYTGTKARLAELESRVDYLIREWEMMNDQLCDPLLDCDTANMLLERYMKIAAELTKCRQERDEMVLLMEQWNKVVKQSRWTNLFGKSLFTWDSIGKSDEEGS